MITSASNPRLKLIRKLESRRQREKLGLFVAEGEDLVDAARAAGIEPADLLLAGEDVEPQLLAGVSTMAHPPRVIGVYRRGDLPPFEQRPVSLALWHVSDPGNVGTLIRTADAFGAAIGLSAGCGDPTGPRALRASAGAVFRVPLGRFDEPAGRRVALVAHTGRLLAELEPAERTVFVLGAEREGLPREVAAACDAVAAIPIAESAESLNVAVAGAIALYEARRLPSTAATTSAASSAAAGEAPAAP
ncbi:MAG TPA: RNA methyltransferase [Gaiellaceae bacterium]|nr:RNA methyltransferase [Gaiellaceae bacterium]